MIITKKYNELIVALKNDAVISNNQVNYMSKILNGDDIDKKTYLKCVLSDCSDNFNLTKEQSEKAYKWLYNLYKSPKGTIRKNTPFGYREQDAIENYSYIQLAGFFDIGHSNYPYNVPLYDVFSNDGYGFQYYVKCGEINIIG